ncbi:uncharacterized protein BXZ73DRAFT_87453 [Epithele typhae]|uniref:uncharacterized protein n=1 Tax=Epithele typhae TaxID=378194 RepID=UPI002007F4A2|nr:uncharacterized protein BXZ73DRAFT_87453 [Epithele typhae]KAH9943007.1 hypothetical protein BXZ73DRAFT_87453 [Epithele typhae]
MEPSVLVAAHLSALWPATLPIPVFSTQKNIPPADPVYGLAQSPEHASSASLFHSPHTGTILSRVSHGGLLLELLSLTHDLPPLRFDFPAAILPSPSIVLFKDEELHVLLVTRFQSLYRLVIPLREGAPLWSPTANRRWYREYVIQTPCNSIVHVHDPYSVVLALNDGSLLRLETERLGGDTTDDVWRETKYDARSFLHSITSLLHTSLPGASDIVSIASHPQPTDIGNVWTLSRDRHLRMWTPRGGCLAEHALPPMAPRALPRAREGALTSGGFFQLFAVEGDALRQLATFEASEASVHCHLQDFTVLDDTLFTLWDKQGQSMAMFDDIATSGGWSAATYAHEAELTPAFLDELLLLSGSMADKFFDAIMRPGTFSPLTLQTAITQYTDTCRSLPPPYPPQLLASYGTVAEQITSVVGCTVQRTKDPKTGAPLDQNYWNALKRDWEGFIARCREIERNGLWPLAIGRGSPDEGIIIVERERIASLAGEDLSLRLHRLLSTNTPVDPQFAFLEVLWTLRSSLDARALRTLEDSLHEVVHQETAFPYPDIIEDQVRATEFDLTIGRLRALGNPEEGGFDKEVKREEDDALLLSRPMIQQWAKALTASYVMTSLQSWDASLLAEIFVVFRGIAMLRYVARHPAGDRETPVQAQAGGGSGEEDVVAKMRNMHVSTSRAHATKLEVLFCERLRLLGYREVAREAAEWLPRTPAVMYVRARLRLDEGRYDEAADALEVLAGSFGPHSGVSVDDAEALAAVLPSGRLFTTQFERHKTRSLMCLHTARALGHRQKLRHIIALAERDQGLTDLGEYEDAYSALVSTPYERLKRESVGQLLYRMCEENAVIGCLSFKARNADPRVRPFYSRILYTWYVFRGDYRDDADGEEAAALTMYQRARKFAVATSADTLAFIEFAELQLEAYVVAMNALALVDPKNQWITLPITGENGHESRKRRKLSRHIPEHKYSAGNRDSEVVELRDMQYEYALLSARVELVQRDPTLLSGGDFALPPESIVLRLAQANRFDTALAVAKSLDVDMSDVFSHLTARCLRLSRDPDSVMGEDTSDWLLSDKVASWPGSSADKGWRYLRQALERHDGPATDYAYAKVALETVMGFDRSAAPALWLVQSLQEQHPEYLIRTCLRYEAFESAIDHTLTMMRKSDSRLTDEVAKTAAVTWLPYTLIDQVLVAVDLQTDLSPRARTLLSALRSETASRTRRVQKYTQAVRSAPSAMVA